VTEHRTAAGKLYLCAIKDVWSNRILGYSITDGMESKIAVDALSNAVARRRIEGVGVAGRRLQSGTVGGVNPELRLLAKRADAAVVGSRLRDARLRTGRTQAQVADGVCSVAYLSRVESGKRRPDPELLAALAERLGVTLAQIVAEDDSEEFNRSRLALDHAELTLVAGDAAAAKATVTRVLATVRRVGPTRLESDAVALAARCDEACGQTHDAIRGYRWVVDHGMLDAAWLRCAVALCRCYREAGELARSIRAGEDALRRLRDLDLTGSTEAIQLSLTLASAYAESGDIGEAERLCRAGVEAAEASDSTAARAAAYWNSSVLEGRRGAMESAIELARKAAVLFDLASEPLHVARLRSLLGIYQLRLVPPRPKEAVELLTQAATELADSSATPQDQARNRLALAHAALLEGFLDQAGQEAAALASAMRGTSPLLAAEAMILSGRVHVAAGEPNDATHAFRQAVMQLSLAGADRAIGQTWFELAGYLDEVGATEEARDAYRSAAAAMGLIPGQRLDTSTRSSS